MCMCIYVSMHIGRHAWAYMCVYMYINTHITYIYECLYLGMYIGIHTWMYVYAYICIYVGRHFVINDEICIFSFCYKCIILVLCGQFTFFCLVKPYFGFHDKFPLFWPFCVVIHCFGFPWNCSLSFLVFLCKTLVFSRELCFASFSFIIFHDKFGNFTLFLFRILHFRFSWWYIFSHFGSKCLILVFPAYWCQNQHLYWCYCYDDNMMVLH